VLGLNGEIRWFNDAAKTILGFRARDIGQRIANLIRHPKFAAFLKEAGESGDIELPSPVDEHLSLLYQIVSYGKDQRLLLARDVTLLHRLEQVRTDFVANVSHEMRTPLTVIHGYLETLAEHAMQMPSDWQRPIKLMYEQSLRMQNLVNDLLVLSRLETSDEVSGSENVAVPEMLATIKKEALALSGEHRHRISLEADGNVWLRGNMQELHSAFSNIVFNAVQYTPDGGEIRVRWYADPAGAHFEVSDNGIGIPAHHIPRLTERFYRVDVGRSRKTGGTGLGLAIVKHVLQRHNGQLRIDSAVGKGSTFICDFPRESIISQLADKTA
jgi:two-component system phosphate regulon sensor histidine kinase PhoR